MTKSVRFSDDAELIDETPNAHLNCSANDDHLWLMRKWLDVLVNIHHAEGCSENEFQYVETSLGFRIPSTLHEIYSRMGKDSFFLTPAHSKHMTFRILKPDELHLEKNVNVYDYYSGEAWYETDVLPYSVTQKDGALYAGIDMKRGWQLSFFKEWCWQKDGMPLYKELVVTLACTAISHMKNIFKAKVKGVSGWEKHKIAEKMFEGWFQRFEDFEHYDHTLFYNLEHRALGWFRAGSAPSDLLVGCEDQAFVDAFITEMNMSKARHEKINGLPFK